MAPLQFCTTSSRRYLPYARALHESIRRTNPGATLHVLLTDDHYRTVKQADEDFVCVWNDELAITPHELHLRFLIHAGMFHIAIKPWIVEHVLDRTGGPVVFIDGDIRLYGPLDDLGGLIAEHGVVLSPHVRAPYPLDGLLPNDITILSAGVYNAGIIGVGRQDQAFLEFWKSRLAWNCDVDIPNMRVAEQRWLDLVPSITHAHVWRDPGVNAAYWNLHERPLSRREGTIYAGEVPLRAFHFSGYDITQPEVFSRYMLDRPRFYLNEQPIVAELAAAYRAGVFAARYEECVAIPVDFAELPGGIPITPELQAIVRAAVERSLERGTPLPPDPYAAASRPAFCDWARTAFPAAGYPVPTWSVDAQVALHDLAASQSAALARLDLRIRALEEQSAPAS